MNFSLRNEYILVYFVTTTRKKKYLSKIVHFEKNRFFFFIKYAKHQKIHFIKIIYVVSCAI